MSPDSINSTVLETHDEVRLLRAEVVGIRGKLNGMHHDRTMMIRMLQAREAKIDEMRSLEQRYVGLRAHGRIRAAAGEAGISPMIGGSIQAGREIYLDLFYDHRIIDGHEAMRLPVPG